MVKRGRETKPVGELVFDAPNHYYDLRQDSVACEPAKDDASDDDWFNQVHRYDLVDAAARCRALLRQ